MSMASGDHESERKRSLEAYEAQSKVIRASDADRDRAVAQLRQHLSDGRLTVEEFTERLDEAYTARTTADIDHALRELPHVSPAGGGSPVPVSPDAERRLRRAGRAGRSLRDDRSLRSSLVGYAALSAMFVLIWLVTSIATGDLQYFWPIWPILGLGIGVVARVGGMYGSRD